MPIKLALFFSAILICILSEFVSSFPQQLEKNGNSFTLVINDIRNRPNGKHQVRETISESFSQNLNDYTLQNTPQLNRKFFIPAQYGKKYPGISVQGLKSSGITVSNKTVTQKRSLKENDINLISKQDTKLKEFSDENDHSSDKNNDKLCENYDSVSDKCLSYRVVGGKLAQISDFPYTVSYNRYCGGSILSENWVLTAAHCKDAGNMINVGSSRLEGGTFYSIKRHIVHPLFNDKTFDNDFQLLEIKTPIAFNDNVQPIRIGTEADLVAGELATVTGWGATKEGGFMSNMLMSADVPIIKNDECVITYNNGYKHPISSRMVCAGYEEGNVDACQGDSGGPLTINDKLIGVVSFGLGCARPGSPGIYANVVGMKKWITEITGIN